ncbi:MAG: hypothetical protein U0N15_00095 [Bifidobacterium choerinum]
MAVLQMTRSDTCTHVAASKDSCAGNDGDFIDVIASIFDDDDGSGDESCNYLYGMCEDAAKFSLIAGDSDGTTYARRYCPKHFLLQLHFIIDATTSDNWFRQFETEAERNSAFLTYYTNAQRIRD